MPMPIPPHPSIILIKGIYSWSHIIKQHIQSKNHNQHHTTPNTNTTLVAALGPFICPFTNITPHYTTIHHREVTMSSAWSSNEKRKYIELTIRAPLLHQSLTRCGQWFWNVDASTLEYSRKFSIGHRIVHVVRSYKFKAPPQRVAQWLAQWWATHQDGPPL